MKGWKDKAKPWLNVLPTGVLAACIGISLSGYEAPVYEVKAAQDTNEESTTEEPTGEVTLDLDNMEITLPPTTSHSGPASGASKTVGKAPEVSGYKDGTYYGTGTGFGGKIRVKVVVKDGKITDITVVESQDGAEYMRAASALLKNIIKTQSTNVDTVSGATYSSAGLIEAVRDALKDAGLTEKNDKKDTKKKDKKEKKTEDTDNTETDQNVTYQDGTYYGTGTGFGGPLKVKVVVTDGKITDIQVIESADDQEYIKAASALLKDIIRTQSTNVDTVSGATYSSKGLIEAVKDALKDAVSTMETEDSKPADTTEQTNPDNTEQNNQSGAIPEGKVPYKDGVYYGTGEGYKGDITVAVTISDHTIRYILVTETSDDEAFFARAKAVLQAIMQKQSTDVDAVSGATFSSKGLIEAVQEALDAAKKATEGGSDRTDSESGGQDGNAGGTKQDSDQDGKTDDTKQDSGTDEEADHTGGEQGTKDSGPDPEDGSNQDTPEEQTPASKLYQDGTYTMAVICNPDSDYDFEPYTLSVTITIKDDKVVSVTDIYQADGEEDNSYYVARATEGTRKLAGVAAQIREKGNADGIDAVSGATCSSRAIAEAVRSMLEGAKNTVKAP